MIYLVKIDPDLTDESNWIIMDGIAFYTFLKTKEGQRRKHLFTLLSKCSENDKHIIIEANKKVAREVNRERHRHEYLKKGRDEKGYTVISYHAVHRSDEDFYGEELLVDELCNVENQALWSIKKEALYDAISALDWEDQLYLQETYLTYRPITDKEYAHIHKLSRKAFRMKKESIFQSLRISLRNNCEFKGHS